MRCTTLSEPDGPWPTPPRLSRLSRYTYPCLPTATARCGSAAVPKYSLGRPVTPPEAKSASHVSSDAASKGAKKSVAFSVPSACTRRRTTDSPRFAGGVLPGVGVVGAPPLPVLSISVPAPSEARPAPDCQIPAPVSVALSTHRAFTLPAVETPNTQPCHGEKSQWLPKAA